MQKPIPTRILAILLAFAMTFSTTPTQAFAEGILLGDSGDDPIELVAQAVNTKALLGTWSGTYTGHDYNVPVARQIQLDIDNVATDGRIEGMATIDNGEHGSYFFEGAVNPGTGAISFEGTDWISNPSDFGFTYFEGTFNDANATIAGIVNEDDSTTFSLHKTSDTYTSHRLSIDQVPADWTGEYDGHDGGIVVRRDYEMHILNVDDDGNINGTAIFSPSEKADAAYGANGSYNFTGTIDARRGKITLQGTSWIEFPVKYDEFDFTHLEGYIDLQSGTITGTSSEGIWSMSVIDYQSIHKVSGFELGRDNNSYAHYDDVKVKPASGFIGVKDYSIAPEYFQKLTAHLSEGERSELIKATDSPWDGSCYGIAMSMGLLYENYISISDLTDGNAKTYYALGYPSKDPKLLSTIMYYQLSQCLQNGGQVGSAVSYTVNLNLLQKLANVAPDADALPVFLKRLVEHCSSDHVAMFCFSTKAFGHAVLVTGCEFDQKANKYKLQIYNENCIVNKGDKGEFTTMYVNKDFSDFTYGDGKTLNKHTYQTMYVLDWNAMGNVYRGTNDSRPFATRLTVPMDSTFTVTNSRGETLTYDGTEFTGDMPVRGINTELDDTPKFVIETLSSSSFSLTNLADNVDFDAFTDGEFVSLSGTSIDSATLSFSNGIQIEGSDYDFKAYVATDGGTSHNDLVSVEATAKGNTSITPEDGEVLVATDGGLTDVTTKAYDNTTAASTGDSYNKLDDDFVVGQNGTVQSDFADVTDKTAHADDISWLAAQKISEGWKMSDGTREFRPYNNVARADMAAFLFRLAVKWGVVSETWQPAGSSPFSDVTQKTAHYREILWLAQSGVSAGWTLKNGTREFRPYANVARADMAAFLARLHRLRDGSTIGSKDFLDVTNKTAHADDIRWLAASGISQGWQVANGYEFRPYANVARADMAAFLHRLNALT